MGLPQNQDKVRGFSNVSLMLIDEASRVSDGDLWLMSTPNGTRGFFYEEWKHGGEEWERIKVTAPECQRISAKFLEEETAREGDKFFRQEYLCEFVEREGQVFSQESIDAAMQDFEPLHH